MSDPPRITSITPTARNPRRATVRVGRKVVATLPTKQIDELGLSVDQPWDEALAARLQQAAQVDKAMRKAMNRLNRRAMSRRDLDRKLHDLEFDQATRQHVLDRLTELKYLDDEALGRALIRETQRARPAGPRLLRQKLFQKGLDRKLIDQLIAETRDTADPEAEAVTLARQRLRRMSRLDPPARQRRLFGLLARRGFEPETINAAMETLRDEIVDGTGEAFDASE
ncbi:MAG: regulatory protein RecX [Phycisphaeraceae bacterium]